jgi:pimeloyl-ACP methyl ester carboxylesterase
MMSNGTNTSFGQLQQIDAGVLNVGYAEAGKSDGQAVILLHGWPYDIHSYVDVAPRLSQAGYRVIVPYLRGYGTTRFLSSDAFLMPPRTPHNALDLGPETGQMLSTYIVEVGQPLSTFTS